MATIVNTPAHEHYNEESSRSSGINMVITVVVLLVLAFLFFYYALPMIRSAAAPQINVPGQVDVNVNTPNQGGAPQGGDGK